MKLVSGARVQGQLDICIYRNFIALKDYWFNFNYRYLLYLDIQAINSYRTLLFKMKDEMNEEYIIF